MNVKAFLKINRMDAHGVFCLRYWCELFREYETYIICDKFTQGSDPIPAELTTVNADYPNIQIINSDYTSKRYFANLKPRKVGMAMANVTPIMRGDSDAFWIIDADDTMFLTHAFDSVRERLRVVEQQFAQRNLDAYSLDFYRNHNNGWTFGVALIRTAISLDLLSSVDGMEMRDLNFARNIDSVFHVLWKKQQLNCANFVFGGMAFQHTYNNYPLMPQGVYYWNKGCLWDQPLQPDVVTI